MTTLVLGAVGGRTVDYARWLLREQSAYTEVDAATLGGRLLGALLSSRRSVLLHGIEEWVHTIAASPDLTFAEQEVLASRMDELVRGPSARPLRHGHRQSRSWLERSGRWL
ncbi:MAG: hypothetical protein WA880_14020 [Ornithinimicrobium sp.]